MQVSEVKERDLSTDEKNQLLITAHDPGFSPIITVVRARVNRKLDSGVLSDSVITALDLSLNFSTTKEFGAHSSSSA